MHALNLMNPAEPAGAMCAVVAAAHRTGGR
jgi:hypothetical protein